MTLEEQLLNDAQSAYERYADGVAEEGGSTSRVRRVGASVYTLVGTLSEVNWTVRHEREW